MIMEQRYIYRLRVGLYATVAIGAEFLKLLPSTDTLTTIILGTIAICFFILAGLECVIRWAQGPHT